MIIPRKQPPQSKAEVQAAFTQFAVLHEEAHTDYGWAIEIVPESWARTVFLKILGGAGAARRTSAAQDPCPGISANRKSLN